MATHGDRSGPGDDARAGVVNKSGGPVGAVIAKDGQVVSASGNSVVRDLDPSAHAEVNAIRAACKAHGTWDLTGCDVPAANVARCVRQPPTGPGYGQCFMPRLGQLFRSFSTRRLMKTCRNPGISGRSTHAVLQDEACSVWKEFRLLPDGARY